MLGTVDQHGTVVSTRKYDVYGAVRGSTGPSGTKHKFVANLGHPSEDETGLVYMRARYYDPVTGGFCSEDPAHDGTNWMVYAKCAPSRYLDVTGKAAGDELFVQLMALADDLHRQARFHRMYAGELLSAAKVKEVEALAISDAGARQMVGNTANYLYEQAFKRVWPVSSEDYSGRDNQAFGIFLLDRCVVMFGWDSFLH